MMALSESFERALAPLDVDFPCGPSARHDAVVTDIRLLREEDDPDLPMGQWARPLKQADWPRIEQHCIDLLAERSKDLQTVVWLIEAWMRQHGYTGLCRGLALLDALLRRYWATLHPLIEDEGEGLFDVDARLAPLEWLNGSLSRSTHVHATLFTLPAARPPQVTLAVWDGLDAEVGGGSPGTLGSPGQLAQAADAAPTRAAAFASADAMAAELAATRTALQDGLRHLDAITGYLREQLPDQAPGLPRLYAVLQSALRVVAQVQAGQTPAPTQLPALAIVELLPDIGVLAGATAPPNSSTRSQEPPAPGATAGWNNRDEAYATLEALSDYLARLEPHSPTPFLLRRAVRWGAMPLPEVLAEVMREEGDLNRLINVLGLQSQ